MTSTLTRPDVAPRPDAARPDAAQSDVARSDAARSDAARSGATAADAVHVDPAQAVLDADGCAHLVVELCPPGFPLDALAKIVTMLRGRRWEVRAVDADLDAGVVRLVVRTDRVELLAGHLGRVACVAGVRAA